MNRRKDDMKTRLLATFREEADDHLKTIAKNLIDLERGLSSDQAGPLIEGTFREMHTLKGAARSVGLSEIESRCGISFSNALKSADSVGERLARRPEALRERKPLDSLSDIDWS